VSQQPGFQVGATAVNGCGCTSSITVNPLTPSTCPLTSYTYQLLPGGLPQASNTFSNLCPGCYTIVVTDCNGCTATVVQCVTGASAPNVNAVVTNVSCNGVSDGSICITNATGTINPCLQYRIGTSCTNNTTTWQFNPCFNNLPAGNYCIQIKDTCTGCDTCICVTVSQQPGFQVGATAVNGCGCTSSITVNPLTPSTCPLTSYTYQLLPGGLPQASNTFT
jgi:large repetitive protein